ncbi:acyl carrier protein [Firmicutes bacterium CAG:631]|nr:acyl carrier protein [Firmicutes bacterium CAG:631]
MFERVKKVLVAELGVDENQVTMESNIIEDLHADSLSVMQVIMGLEDEFGISVEDDDVKDLLRVKDIVAYLEQHVK